ncbi:MAG TPA: MFS transporter [Hyphomicrobiales bacterium]|nr:MFS transporter [Hyphomicrobiales bacterium]
MSTSTLSESPWSPLRLTAFRWLWLATLVSNIGTWMHETGAGWLISTLTDSPVVVALLQTATSLPAFFILLPSGALSDILDRRRYLMSGNIGMAVTAIIIGTLTVSELITADLLLLLTLMMGIGTAMIMPTWQSIIPEVVPRSELQAAIGLNTMGMNIARVIGSLVAGAIIASLGTGVVFVCNACSFLFVIFALWRWKRVPPTTALPPERFKDAILTGLRYTRHSPALQATIFRSVGFYLFASVMWAMLPLIARDLLGGDARTYSFLFAAISIGAIGSALLIPAMRRHLNNDQLITYSSLLFAVGMSLTALVHVPLVAMLALCLCGGAWITVMTCAQLSAQTALPNWVKSRGLAIFLTFFMGSLAIGPIIWGSLTKWTSLPISMLTASLGLVIFSRVTQRWPVSGNDELDHTPSQHWRKPELKVAVAQDQGPVMLHIRYEVIPGQLGAFLHEMRLLGMARRRDGAVFWDVFEDAQNPRIYVETVVVQSWLDHLRQHERISRQDAQIQLRIRALLQPGTEPVIRHFVKPAG